MDDVQSKNITIEIGGENMAIVTKEDFIRRMSERFGCYLSGSGDRYPRRT